MIRKGTAVTWSWGGGTASGQVVDRFTSDVTRTLKGTSVTRKASEDAPAFLIRQEDGDEVLKSITEIERA
ncbi:hypothetical protein roselon_02835 [Roseibacterium elongatum DSM 19469]|uniref:Hypervirulence associated protein TUDOR domain-containing protein n=1 Tax=Roseicyclus elongatus DSM 19469 TaxID=1294273 RepID=W8RV42_9RHOB|nr:DUF2945 domain-containing protein [Roseibacterium elongatum]AHM05133.1 hypothetical protein roselon_02835 [Roseibacterium elongatum DSM 19469]